MPPNPPSKRVASPRAAWRFTPCKYLHFSRKILNPPPKSNPRYATDDWHLDTSHLIGKVRLKNKQKSCHIGSCQDIIELFDIRDGLVLCDTLSNDDV